MNHNTQINRLTPREKGGGGRVCGLLRSVCPASSTSFSACAHPVARRMADYDPAPFPSDSAGETTYIGTAKNQKAVNVSERLALTSSPNSKVVRGGSVWSNHPELTLTYVPCRPASPCITEVWCCQTTPNSFETTYILDPQSHYA